MICEIDSGSGAVGAQSNICLSHLTRTGNSCKYCEFCAKLAGARPSLGLPKILLVPILGRVRVSLGESPQSEPPQDEVRPGGPVPLSFVIVRVFRGLVKVRICLYCDILSEQESGSRLI